MTYPEALTWLYSTQHFGIKLGLENICRLLKELGVNDGNRRAGQQRVIHVAGTNGKGSVCAMLDSICRTQNYRVGLYTSPHLVEFRERIRIKGEMISEESAAMGLTRIREIAAKWEHSPTFFEIVTALAMAYFAGDFGGGSPTEIVVLETGLGGRLDATNAITPAVTVLTPIDLDHQAYLGDTLGAIAAEKAGIIKHGVPCVSAAQREEAAAVIMEAARDKGASVEFIANDLRNLRDAKGLSYEIGLLGEHQVANAALAVRALELSGICVSEEAIHAGLRDVRWPGRFQQINTAKGQTLILDGAHNLSAAEKLVHTWRSVFGDQKATIILGILRDKDFHSICRSLAPIAERFIVTPVRSERSCSTEEVLASIRLAQFSGKVQVASDLTAALAEAEIGIPPVLVTGSLFLIGEALALFEGTQTRPSLQ